MNQSADISLAQVRQTLEWVAWALVNVGPEYLPLFERLEAEVAAREKECSVIERARAALSAA